MNKIFNEDNHPASENEFNNIYSENKSEADNKAGAFDEDTVIETGISDDSGNDEEMNTADNAGESNNIEETYNQEEADSIEETSEEESDDVQAGFSDDESTPNEDSRREYRRKRRIRNQIIAYGAVAVVLILLIAAGINAGRRISSIIKGNKQDKELIVDQTTEQDIHIETEPEEIVVEAPPEIEEITLDEQLEEIVNNCIAVMPLEDKVAGLFFITPEALTGVRTALQAGESTQEALGNYPVGGLIYFSQNIQSKEQLTQMLANTVSMSKYPIFLAVDEEGGSVSRVAQSAIDVTQVDDMQTIGMTGDSAAAYEAGLTIGSYLDELGFNLDFAPVADVVTNFDTSPLGNRSFSSDPELCAEMVSKIVGGMEETSINTCLKHFPGIGSTDGDTHNGRVEIAKTLDEMKNSDFIPFQAGIEAGADLIMVSHVISTGLDTEGVPSSLSRTVITDVLRTELGYEGIVITDALNMSAISNYYTSGEAAINAVIAGADMLLMPENFKDAYETLLAAVQNGRISEERIDESLRRIYRIKYADKLENQNAE